MIRTLSAALGALLLMIAIALSVFLMGGTDAGLYFRVQKSVVVGVGVLDTATRKADEAIADYLKSGGGGLAILLSEREVVHMKDVYDLFQNMRRIRAVAFPLGLFLIGASAVKNRFWARVLMLGGAVAAAVFLLPLAVVGVWALIDFHGAFRMMHRLLFDNMLWLLDPSDLLIRLLPEEFFERIGAILALRSVLFALIPPTIMVAGPLIYGKWMRR